ALRKGGAVERSWLAATLWPESDDEGGRFNLRRNLTDIRQLLGTQAWRLEAVPPRRLRLDLSGAWCDLVEFDAAIAGGDEAILAGAVELYRGPLLEGCAAEWAERERRAREEAYLEALARLARLATERRDAGAA